jgi:hypothetical protein
MSLLQIAVRVASRRYAQTPAASEDSMSFSGKLSQRFDGENCYAEGQLTIDGQEHEFTCGTGGRDPAQCTLDGQPLSDDALQQRIELFMTDIWPPEDGNWDATVQNNVTSSPPTPAQDEQGGGGGQQVGQQGQQAAPTATEDPQSILKRAEDAEADASRWHQGSGIHAGKCLSLVEEHLEAAEKGGQDAAAHLEAAVLWANAAEAEAKGLHEVQGDWLDFDDWAKTEAGLADSKAASASNALGIDSSEY